MPHRDRAASHTPAQGSETQAPEPKYPAGVPAVPEIISHTEMNAACDQNLAVPLGQVIRYILRYLDSWWIPFEGGWIRADPALAAMLDAESARMTAQDAIIARNAAIRAAINSVPAPGNDKEAGGDVPLAPDPGGSDQSSSALPHRAE